MADALPNLFVTDAGAVPAERVADSDSDLCAVRTGVEAGAEV